MIASSSKEGERLESRNIYPYLFYVSDDKEKRFSGSHPCANLNRSNSYFNPGMQKPISQVCIFLKAKQQSILRICCPHFYSIDSMSVSSLLVKLSKSYTTYFFESRDGNTF